VALALARSQDDAQAAASYKTCMAAPGGELYAECGARLGDLYLKDRDIDYAKAAYRKVSASRSTASAEQASKKKKRSKKGLPSEPSGTAGGNSPFVGYSRYRLATLLEQSTQFERLALPEASLKKALNQRLDFLEPLSRAYLSAVEAGGPWAVAALDRLASYAMGFADDVDGISPPPQADAAAVARFRAGLGSVSAPLRRKAVNAWLEAYAKAATDEMLSPALPAIGDHLADAHVASPSRAQGFRGRFRLAGIPADGGDAGKSKALKLVREKLAKNAQDGVAWIDYGNLLWGGGKPLLARIAYERALSISPRSAAALNNRGVVLISSEGEEDWQGALEGAILFQDSLKQDEFFLAAKMNRAALLNYYRLFDKAKRAWDEVLVKDDEADVNDGLGVALQGLGQYDAATVSFHKAKEAGASSSRFVAVFHEAARLSGEKCLSRLGDLNLVTLPGFEKLAAENLKRSCANSKSEATSK
jgi:tetratricopeptide (TPR) repeat protein